MKRKSRGCCKRSRILLLWKCQAEYNLTAFLEHCQMLPRLFWDKVDKAGPVPAHRPDLGPCWLWTGSKAGYAPHQYGQFGVQRIKKLAHRLSYTELFGEIPINKQLDHLCRTPSCVNPSHLELVTSRMNTLRGTGPTSVNAKKTHCIHGHAFAGDNLYQHIGGKRTCRICRRKIDRNRSAKKRQTISASR